MSIARLIGYFVIVLGVTLMLNLACASQTNQTPEPAINLPSVPSAPAQSQPGNGSTVSNVMVTLGWRPSTGASSYRLQVATDSAFTHLVEDKSEISSTSCELTSGLNWKTIYYWRVNATNAGGTSPWSEIWTFTTPVLELGKIVFQSNRDGNFEVYIMNDDGSNQTNITNNPNNDGSPTFSPDGAKIAFISDRDGNTEICIMNVDGTNQMRLTNNIANDGHPVWSPDGSKIAFSSTRDGNYEIYIMNADGSNQARLTSNPAEDSQPSWR